MSINDCFDPELGSRLILHPRGTWWDRGLLGRVGITSEDTERGSGIGGL